MVGLIRGTIYIIKQEGVSQYDGCFATVPSPWPSRFCRVCSCLPNLQVHGTSGSGINDCSIIDANFNWECSRNFVLLDAEWAGRSLEASSICLQSFKCSGVSSSQI